MSGFVGNAPAQPFNLTNDGFWPDIDAAHLRERQRIGSNVTNARLEEAAVAAMISVNRELRTLKLRYMAQGAETLKDVPAEQIQDESELVHTYRRAIYSTASAEVAERYRTYSATNSGAAKGEQEEQSADDYRRDARFAIRDLLGISRSTVVLL
ncbi:head completion/stabilization protein [Ectopseudomonas mendocina]|uniref:head completion/stabilization protein n=1 Tax=Ectopseudomonas mendocina TaxID=300 RepID=UPI000206DF50|nr:head completion/stabilization protein [Pseudomonas mendocina]AEB58226.1 phage P2 capsid completion gpL-like protein [Pseudomonas mendocina NK-01]